jgi:hypothetical protein
METLAFQNKRCGDPVMHLLLSWKENENPTPDQVKDAVLITLEEMNLSQCQAVYSLHQNTDVRKAQTDLKNMDVRTWKELHNFMREHGMEYQKKGSGAVINVGDAIIKASSVSRNFALNKLEKRLGEYQPFADRQQQMNPQSVEKISESKPLDKLNENENWKVYIERRSLRRGRKRRGRGRSGCRDLEWRSRSGAHVSTASSPRRLRSSTQGVSSGCTGRMTNRSWRPCSSGSRSGEASSSPARMSTSGSAWSLPSEMAYR